MATRDDIAQAYAEGRAHLHILEYKAFEKDTQQQAFFDVLAGTPGAHFENEYRDVEASADGLVGLATTALHEAFPVIPWPKGNDLGLLMVDDGSDAFRPLLVEACDAGSRIDRNILSLSPLSQKFPELRAMQKLNTGSTKFDIESNREVRVDRARSARTRFWELLKEQGWDEYTRGDEREFTGMNETVAIAHLASVKGITVYVKPGAERRYERNLREAAELSAWLSETYPETFPEKLPVYSYDPTRGKDCLQEVPPKELEAVSSMTGKLCNSRMVQSRSRRIV